RLGQAPAKYPFGLLSAREAILAADWDDLDLRKYAPEEEACAALLAAQPFGAPDRALVAAEARGLVEGARKAARGRRGVVESFLQEFGLGTREGLALMCLAEALLRTPDEATRDRLISEKIGGAD